jgi:hypothetical protein
VGREGEGAEEVEAAQEATTPTKIVQNASLAGPHFILFSKRLKEIGSVC